MKKLINIISRGFVLLILIGLSSCKDYLEKSPDSVVSSTDAFVSFTNFQGFVEELYGAVPCIVTRNWASDWSLADEMVHDNDNRLSGQFDKGDSWCWFQGHWLAPGTNWLNSDRVVIGAREQGLWLNAWYAIRKANLGLANLDKLKNATQEEKDLLKGQMLFFRAWFYFELTSYWGGMPYIDWELLPSEKLTLPRLNCQQTLDRVAKDLREAADLLPSDWDNTTVGALTSGKNRLRVTKIAALGYLGKAYLYAGSPLMNKESTGNESFNVEYCKKSAAAFAELFSHLSETKVSLVNFKDYNSLFYTNGKYPIPGAPEAIFQSLVSDAGLSGSRWGASSIFVSSKLGGGYCSPSARYVDNYGMANGLPITDPESGYNPADPWSNRDPRFYNDIVKDGDEQFKASGGDKEKYRYAALYTGGHSRNDGTNSRTGYLLRKLTPITCNDVDGWPSNYMHLSFMRLADVYLMYAEAALQGYGSARQGVPGSLTAEEAFNKVRTRCGAGAVAQKFVDNKDLFMEEIIRERAVELSYEGDFRYVDVRRWRLATNMKYRLKTAIDFDRGPNGKPVNMRERVLYTRVFEEKHYWLPLKTKDVSLYASFAQNPGW